MASNLNDRVARLTPEQRAKLKDKIFGAAPGRESPIGRRADRTAPVPLSPTQRRLWILSSLDANNTAYNLPSMFRVSGRLDRAALQAAVDRLEQRHEILRTVYGEDAAGEPHQLVLPARGATVHVRNLRDVERCSREQALRAAVLDEANVRFDLRQGPVWRVGLIELAEEEAVLVLTVHHIAFDGWSLGVLVRELFDNYANASNGRSESRPALPFQYADYSVWRNERIAKLRHTQQEFWRGYLAGAPAVLELPLDRPRPEQSSGAGAMQQLILPRELFTRLFELGKSEQATPFNVFMALFNVLLLRYTGQEDLVLGTPVSGRDQDDIHDLIGVFANTLPIRTRIDPNASFRAAVRATRAAALDAFGHADLPFDAIVEATRPERVAGCNPVFQVMFAYQNKVDPVQLDDLFVIYEIFDPGTTKFDLSLDIFEGPEGPTCLFEYDTALFTHERITRMLAHFRRLAERVLEDPDQPVSRIDYLSDEECALALGVCPLRRHLPYQGSVVDIFNDIAAAHGDATAVVDGHSRLSYRQLEQRAEHVAAALAQAGVRRGTVVGVSLPRGAALAESLLAILKCGAAFVALDPNHPPNRLVQIAADARVGAILTQLNLAGTLPAFEAPVLTYEALHEQPAACAPASRIEPGDLAYIVYTSGTTGNPKGTGITHRNWANALHGWVTAYGLGRDVQCHLQMASFPFDVFCGDFIRALGSGGTLVFCPQDLLGDPAALYALMASERVDCAEFVPAVFRAFARWLRQTGRRLDFMRVLIVASDSWYRDEYLSFKTLLGERGRLINSYGMAEATIDSTWFEDACVDESEADARAGQLVPIGRPFPNVDVYVLDRHLQLVPPGIVGEICVGGFGVSIGYLNQPELNRTRFVPDPFSSEPGARLYRSGDLGRLRADGQLELLGRNDQQVKIRGQRIELADIETALLRHPGVAQCAAAVWEGVPGEKRLVAYIVPPDGMGAPDAAALRDHLQAWVPPYMVPLDYVFLATLPLSSNGKLDRKALPAPAKHEAEAQRAFVAPRTESEQRLAGIWCDVLELPRIGIHDSFFALGGHSLLAFQVIARVRKQFAVDLSVQQLFLHPTVAALARVITDLQEARGAAGELPSGVPQVTPDPAHRFEPFPLTPVQQAYWLGRRDVFEFSNVTAHSYDEFEIPALDPACLERAWNRVIRRHDMLRAVVRADGTQQVLREVPYYAVRVVDLRNAARDEMEDGLRAIRSELSHQMLDVQAWPAFDVRVSLLPGDKARVHFSTDAIMFDVWSFLLALQDLVQFYVDASYEPAPLELSFRDYVLAEEAMRTGPRYQRALEYWRRRVPDLPPAPELPLARNPAQVKQPRFTRLHATLDAERWDRLKRRATQAGLTPTGVLLAAYAEVLARFARSPRFSLNLTFLNRHPVHPKVNEVVGEFTSLTLLSVDGTGVANFTERARKIQSDLWNDLEHHDIGGVQVLREIARTTGDPTRARMPVVFTSALVVPMPKREADFPVTPMHRDGITQTSQVWLDCGVWEEEGTLLCNWDVVKEMYPPGVIEEMFDCFHGFVRDLADDADLWTHATPALIAVAQQRRPEPITPPVDAEREQTLVSLFLQRLAEDAQRCAVETPERQWTYEELAQHAASIRNQVHAHGVARGELVVVAMHKGWEQAAATLGIMAAGAAYLPIDPDLPSARIEYLLQHGQVRQLLTQPWLRDQFAGFAGLQVHVVDEDSRAPAADLVGSTTPAPDDLAYVIFTSGSTGLPKGVVIDHRGAVNTIVDLNERFGITREDSVLAVSALNFDLSVYDLFGLFAAGGRVVFPDHERRLDPVHWMDLVRTRGVTLWNTVPALMGLLVDHAEVRQLRLPSLRGVWMSGDWIPVSLPDRIRAVAPSAGIVGLGGATEASIWSILYPIEAVDHAWQSIPYGRAMEYQGVYVLDHNLEPCPTWVTGDLYIGGVGLARGYWRDAEKTNAAFIVHPRTGARLYRTGDLGRWSDDGNIEFLGRADFQVKVQGHRIELGEIETTLRRHTAIKEAVVIAAGDLRGQKRLVGYLVPQDGAPLDVEEVRGFLRAQLPEYMVPQICVVLERLPLSANGKVDRNKLPAPEFQSAARAIEYVAPRNPLEERLAAICRELLGVERIGVFDNFFSAGGDSMAAIRLLTRVHSGIGGDLTLAHVFAAPCIAALAESLAASQTGAEKAESQKRA